MAYGAGAADRAGVDRARSGSGGEHRRWLEAVRRGDFAAALTVNDAVLACRDPATRDDPRLPYHERWVWDGRGFDGCEVLVRCYHGLGDTVQFARYLPALRQRAASFTLECQPALIPLLASTGPADRIIPFDPAFPAPPADREIEIMELAHALRQPPEAAPPPYLVVDRERVAAARQRLGGPGQALRIALCWRSGGWDEARSVPLAALAAACAGPTGAELAFVSLQRGAAAADALAPDAPLFLNAADRSMDVLATASLVLAADLVITVDTFVAHLAGALGAPVWLLLKAQADWRWMERRRDSPWYPTMRLYRQSLPGDWREPLAQLRDDLRVWASMRSAAAASSRQRHC